MLLFKRRKTAVNVDAATKTQDLTQHWRDWRTMIVAAADGTEPSETRLNVVEELLGKTDDDFEGEVHRIKDRRYKAKAKATIQALVAEIRSVREETLRGLNLDPSQAGLIFIPREAELQERLRLAESLPSPADDVPEFLAIAISDNRSEMSNLTERFQSLTSQRVNVEALIADAKKSRARTASHVTATTADFYGIDAKIKELENALASIDAEQLEIPKRLAALKSRGEKLMAMAERDDAWLLLPQDI